MVLHHLCLRRHKAHSRTQDSRNSRALKSWIGCAHRLYLQQTNSNNTWVQGVFKNWLLCRNASKDPTIEKFPVDILQTDYETSVVDRALAAFVLEAKRMDGWNNSFLGHFDHLFTFLHGSGLQSEFVLTIHSLALFVHLLFYHFLSHVLFFQPWTVF